MCISTPSPLGIVTSTHQPPPSHRDEHTPTHPEVYPAGFPQNDRQRPPCHSSEINADRDAAGGSTGMRWDWDWDVTMEGPRGENLNGQTESTHRAFLVRVKLPKDEEMDYENGRSDRSEYREINDEEHGHGRETRRGGSGGEVRTKESVSCGGTEAKRWNCRRRCPNGRVVARVEKRYRERPYESGDQMKGLSSGATQIARRKREKRAEERNKSNAGTGSVQMKGRGERWIPLTCVGIRSAVQRRQHGAIRVESGEV
ncbi:hypothetical protein C8J57DRAFT_1470209 [Mycena rebaudengoi]|nr:hypothetical protein C8J57DRAFT_1470209 [Mycena rebaudengoi]